MRELRLFHEDCFRGLREMRDLQRRPSVSTKCLRFMGFKGLSMLAYQMLRPHGPAL